MRESGRFQIDCANEIYKIANEAIEKVSMCLGNGTNDGTAPIRRTQSFGDEESVGGKQGTSNGHEKGNVRTLLNS